MCSTIFRLHNRISQCGVCSTTGGIGFFLFSVSVLFWLGSYFCMNQTNLIPFIHSISGQTLYVFFMLFLSLLYKQISIYPFLLNELISTTHEIYTNKLTYFTIYTIIAYSILFIVHTQTHTHISHTHIQIHTFKVHRAFIDFLNVCVCARLYIVYAYLHSPFEPQPWLCYPYNFCIGSVWNHIILYTCFALMVYNGFQYAHVLLNELYISHYCKQKNGRENPGLRNS